MGGGEADAEGTTTIESSLGLAGAGCESVVGLTGGSLTTSAKDARLSNRGEDRGVPSMSEVGSERETRSPRSSDLGE